MVILMEKLHQFFLCSNAGVEFIECCSLPCIYFPDTHLSGADCFVEVFCILDGTVDLIFNGLSKKEILSGELILLNRRESDYFVLSGSSDTAILHAKILPCGLYQDLVMCQGYNEHLQLLRKERTDILPAAVEMMKLLLHLNLREEKTHACLFMEISIALFFVQLYLMESPGSLLTLHDPKHQLSGLMLEIIKNPGTLWQVKDMAKKYSMSTNLFISEFRKASGLTPFNFLKKIRLRRGKQLLENTDKPVCVIASECGYNSHASFTFYIRQEFGMSPVKIRENAQKKT